MLVALGVFLTASGMAVSLAVDKTMALVSSIRESVLCFIYLRKLYRRRVV